MRGRGEVGRDTEGGVPGKRQWPPRTPPDGPNGEEGWQCHGSQSQSLAHLARRPKVNEVWPIGGELAEQGEGAAADDGGESVEAL